MFLITRSKPAKKHTVSIAMPNIDFRGARGSNAGDQFHELWALQQILDLLRPDADLKAVGVEGVRAETPSQNADNPTWDGVDCALYYGGTTLETTDRIELVQLKYSAANPETAWSVARLIKSTAKKGNNSVIRKMANDFNDAKSRMKPGAKLVIRLVSNQSISAGLKKALGARWSGNIKSAGIEETTVNDLKLLASATGLAEPKFQEFLEVLDFSECGSHSRFAVKEKVVATVAGLIGNDVSSEVRDFQVKTRELMLPERAREIVTVQDVLVWFGLSNREGLFPCPPDIRMPARAVERPTTDEAVVLLAKGERLILVHGVGGSGKTTLMRQISDRLPEGSVTVFFDCFGGGRCGYSDDKRHLPENAFLHLTNDLAVALRLPLFIPRSAKYPATIKTFMEKLHSAGDALKQLAPSGMLVVIIDAADNSVAAANNANPPERSFVHDLFEANLLALPENVRIITSCRTDTSRRESLRLPPNTPEVICPPFSKQDTKKHLETVFPILSDSLLEQFHTLSSANPRVQAYAIAEAKGVSNRLLEALLPGGKSLPDVLRASFDNALKKLGQPEIFEKLVGALAYLPAPVAVSSIARIAGCTEDTVRNLAIDLMPGLRLHEGATVTVADEDFDAFIKDKGAANRDAIIAGIAKDFIATFHDDPYSSIHVADSLIAAGRARDILSVIERDPQAAAIGDPIMRRQVQVRRLKLSLAACREAGSTTDALKTVLISAEAEHDESRLNEVLENEMDLSVEFAGSSLRRAILLDPERIEEHGSFLAQDAVRAIRSYDHTTAREQLCFHRAWLRRRGNAPEEELKNWRLTDRDISARVETILELADPKAALDEIMGWRPRDVSLRVAFVLLPQLIASEKTHQINALLKEYSSLGPWDLLLWVPLALAGEPVSGPAIQLSLQSIRRRFIPDVSAIRFSSDEEAWQKKLLDTFIMACELAFKLNLDGQIVLGAVSKILEAFEGKEKQRLFASDARRFDGLLRCWLLKEAISGRDGKVVDFIAYVKDFNPPPELNPQHSGKKVKKRAGTAQPQKQDDEQIKKYIQALFPIYSARLEILAQAGKNLQIKSEQLDKLSNVSSHYYSFDNDYDSHYLREMAAQSVMALLVVESIEASELVKRASTLAVGRFGDSVASRREKLWAWMRFRTSESNNLVRLVAKAADDIKELRAASSDKLDAFIRLSRLILPVSREDAEALFNDAISVAKEIDQEAIDQIDFVSALAEHAHIATRSDRRTIAADIFMFVSGAAERLSDRDGFPWKSAVHGLTCVDDVTALATICRWADDGTVSLDNTLGQFLLTGLQRSCISTEVATSLAALIGGTEGGLRKELVSRAEVQPQKFKAIIEELAKETLLLSPQHERLLLGQEIVDRISKIEGEEGAWLASLRDTVAFLRHIADNKPEKEMPTHHADNNVPRWAGDDDPPKAFEFDPQGKSFVTPESIAEVLEAAKSSGLRHDDRKLLRMMRDASSSLRNRVSFLNALASVPVGVIWCSCWVGTLSETLAAWNGTPGVDRWCKESLPSILSAHFYDLTRWLKQGQSFPHQLMDYTGLDANGRLQIILSGVAQAGEALNSHALFAIAEEIALALDPDEAGAQLLWYARRLRNRLPAEDQALYSLTEIPNDITEAVARFLFALMSDIDTRVRWKAAYALRRLARLDCFNMVSATLAQASRTKDVAFRIPTGPFYFLSAKLWLAIAIYRISVETPQALSLCKPKILDLATSGDLPHVGIREYAKRTLLQLASAGAIILPPAERIQVDQINIAIKGEATQKNELHRSLGCANEEKRRFKFDETDTIRYWYENILRIFPTVSQDQVLEMAERWIIDKWGASPEANWWANEPRKGRYDERRFGLWSHSHGSLPTVERYGTHLEWNAMYCVVGELLTTHPITKSDDYYFDRFDDWLERVLPTSPPEWLSDNLGPTPLELRLWKEDSRTDKGWLHNVRRDEFLNEIGVKHPSREGWVVIKGNYTAHFPKREANIRISSALVSPDTGPALVRAFQTVNDPWDSHLPDDVEGEQIDTLPFRLFGWLKYVEGGIGFDENDPFRFEVGPIRVKPGRLLVESLELVKQEGSPRTWICSGSGDAALIYEAWCGESAPEGDYAPRNVRSDGWRLWARADIVQAFLAKSGWDLICKVTLERRLRNENGRSNEMDAKRKVHDKFFLLKADGSVADTKGHIGSWSGVS